MNDRVKILKQLVGDSLYSVDQYAVADAIVLRACVRRAVPEPFRTGLRRNRWRDSLKQLGQSRLA